MLRLFLFAKTPRLGHVKTRLVPPLAPEQALGLYRAFLADQLRFLREFVDRAEVEVCLDRQWVPDAELAPLLGALPIVSRQTSGDLGDRLLAAMLRAADEGAEGSVVLGVDSPTLPHSHLSDALRALRHGAPGVIAPAEDGGYVLIGLSRIEPELFRDIPWGGPEVCRLTLERAARRGLELTRLRPWYDVDDGPSLARLIDELATSGGRERAPATSRFVATLGMGG